MVPGERARPVTSQRRGGHRRQPSTDLDPGVHHSEGAEILFKRPPFFEVAACFEL